MGRVEILPLLWLDPCYTKDGVNSLQATNINAILSIWEAARVTLIKKLTSEIDFR